MILMTFLNFEMKFLNLFITNIQNSTIEGTILIFLFLLLQIIVLCCLRTLDYSHLLAIPQKESQHFNNRQFSSGLFHLIYLFLLASVPEGSEKEIELISTGWPATYPFNRHGTQKNQGNKGLNKHQSSCLLYCYNHTAGFHILFSLMSKLRQRQPLTVRIPYPWVQTTPLCFIKVLTSMVVSGIIITTIIIFV